MKKYKRHSTRVSLLIPSAKAVLYAAFASGKDNNRTSIKKSPSHEGDFYKIKENYFFK